MLQRALADRYTVERELGRGGMATVYLARDLKHHRPVALKVLHPQIAAVLGAERFLREIDTAANLNHPHILPLFDSGATGQQAAGQSCSGTPCPLLTVNHSATDQTGRPSCRWTTRSRLPMKWPTRSAMPTPAAAAQGRSFDLLLGRRTYDIWAGYWPKAENSPIADGLNAATKYVATHRPDSLGWGPVEDLGADIIEGVRGIKSKDGPDLIVWGSSTLTSVLLEQGLVDEVLLLVYPVLLGRGKRFFSDSADPRELALVSTKAASSGVLMNTYRHVGSLRTESFADASG